MYNAIKPILGTPKGLSIVELTETNVASAMQSYKLDRVVWSTKEGYTVQTMVIGAGPGMFRTDMAIFRQ